MRFLWLLSGVLIGAIVSVKFIHIERRGEGEGETNVYIIIGIVNNVPKSFNETAPQPK
jgi:hypothetical protein